METNQNQYPLFRSLWVWWLFTSLLYLVFNALHWIKEGDGTPLGHLGGFIGLFVPYGWVSLIVSIMPMGLVSIVVFFILMFIIDIAFSQWNLTLGRRILYNLIALLLLTILVDAIRGTFFQSWVIFFKGAFPHYCC